MSYRPDLSVPPPHAPLLVPMTRINVHVQDLDGPTEPVFLDPSFLDDLAIYNRIPSYVRFWVGHGPMQAPPCTARSSAPALSDVYGFPLLVPVA